MLIKKAIICWLVSEIEGPALTTKDKRINSLMPLVSTLFPGINYYSTTGFHEVMKEHVMPVLRKLFPEFQSGSTGQTVAPNEMVEVSEFLPSKGYEWQDSEEWKARFATLVTA